VLLILNIIINVSSILKYILFICDQNKLINLKNGLRRLVSLLQGDMLMHNGLGNSKEESLFDK